MQRVARVYQRQLILVIIISLANLAVTINISHQTSNASLHYLVWNVSAQKSPYCRAEWSERPCNTQTFEIIAERYSSKDVNTILFIDEKYSQSPYRKTYRTRMWADAQRDCRPAEYRWQPLFNAAVWLTPTTRVPCSNAAKTRNALKLAGVPQTTGLISAASGPKFTILWGHL